MRSSYIENGLNESQLKRLARRDRKLNKHAVKDSSIHLVKNYERPEFNLIPKNKTQREQLDALNNYEQVVCIGPAGTGKTYVSVAWAAMQFNSRRVKKLVITRPNIPAGPTLGLFPGSLEDKYSVWLSPVLTVLKMVIGQGTYEIALKRGDIILQPMETIRGASFDDAIVIVDECQNMTIEQMKALVTRIGENTKLILDGDIGQKDIKVESGLEWVLDSVTKSSFLKQNTKIINFTNDDIVRSKLCKAWVQVINDEI